MWFAGLRLASGAFSEGGGRSDCTEGFYARWGVWLGFGGGLKWVDGWRMGGAEFLFYFNGFPAIPSILYNNNNNNNRERRAMGERLTYSG